MSDKYGTITAKIDKYDYTLDFDRYPKEVDIWIKEHSTTSSEIADISTSVNSADGHIYVEDWYLQMQSMEVLQKDDETFLLIKTKP